MADKLAFEFKKKEGKYFTPIVQSVDKYKVENGAVVPDGKKIRGGVKGTYATVRMVLNSTEKAELFALNTEFFPSSN